MGKLFAFLTKSAGIKLALMHMQAHIRIPNMLVQMAKTQMASDSSMDLSFPERLNGTIARVAVATGCKACVHDG